MLKTKTEIVRELIAQSDHAKALSIVKDWQIKNKELGHRIKLGYDCLKNPSFYKQLGKDTEACIKDGIEAMIELLSPKSDV